jgi:AraC-like DNA-binding protein
MSRVAAACGVTIRTLARAFERSMGMTPKTLARVVRLGEAAASLRGGASAADAAAASGYFDQAHMANDFRTMTGRSPSRWLADEGALAVQFLQDPPPGRG